MSIEDDIRQKNWKSQYSKAVVNLIFTANWLNEEQHNLFKPFGLTLPQYNVLRILRGQHPKPATVNLIIERMLDRMSNASRIVDRLVKKGLVVRQQCKEDRRAVDVIISDKGLVLLQDLDVEMEKWETAIQNISEKESEVLNALLDSFRSASPK